MGGLYLLNYDDELQVLAMRYEIPRVGVNPEELVGDTCPWPDADGVHAQRIGGRVLGGVWRDLRLRTPRQFFGKIRTLYLAFVHRY